MNPLAGRLALVFFLASSSSAFAQNLRVIPVPWNQADPSVPHAAYNGHPTTFKAIARGGNGTYTVEWDFQGDGTFDTNVVISNCYDLGSTFTYPVQATRVTFDAVVRVTSNAQTITAVYPVRVEPDVPSDPTFANERQLQVMRSVAIDDALWFLHKEMTRTGDEENAVTGAQVTGYVNHPNDGAGFPGALYGRSQATSAFLWALGLNGHYVAFPPGAYLGTFPAGHEPVNDFRWESDPYAEDVLRCLNLLLTRASVVSITAQDETNNVGVYPEEVLAPIPGSDDLFGLYFGSVAGDQTTNPMGYALAALSVSSLTGLVAQTGDPIRILGKPFELLIQQAVDGLVWAEIDGGGCGFGGWYYSPNQPTCPDAWENLSAVTGLWVADEHMSSSGVIVNNQGKIRIANHFMSHANVLSATEACTPYQWPNAGCDYPATANMVLYGGWLGFDSYDTNDSRIAFPGYLGFTRGQLRTAYDRYRAFVENQWLTWQENDIGWSGGIWELGGGGVVDYERTDHLGNGFTMFQLANAARAHETELVFYGGQRWEQQFSIYDIQNQFADGHTQSDWTTSYWELTYGQKWMSTGWTALTLTGDGIPPYAIAGVSATTAPEGTPITFDASASDPGTRGGSWIWTFDNGDSSTQAVTVYAYPDNGTFDVTLSGTDSTSGTDTFPLTITNVAPSVSVYGEFQAPEGSSIDFFADVTDPGVDDTMTMFWDFDDGATSLLASPSHLFVDDGTFMVVATATDDDGAPGSDTAPVTITNVAPTITSVMPMTVANESVVYAYTLTFTDPGTADIHVCSLPVKPTGMTLTGCTANWTPTYAGLSGATSAAVEICVADGDMGVACQSFTIAVLLTDADSDSLPDGWEIAFFGSIAAQNGAGDPDLDGRTNAQEYADVQDPTAFGGPSAPVLLTPANGVIAGEPSVTLILLASQDPTGDALTYEFELATDATFTTLVESTAGVAGSAATTAWLPTNALAEDSRYCWRARADDGAARSPWSVPACFLRSVANDAPGSPVPLSPPAGGSTSSTRPLLSWLETADPESDAVFYDVELSAASDFATLLASSTGVPGGNAVLDVDLAVGTTYYWRVRGVDGGGTSGAWSSVADFTVVEASDSGDGNGGSGGGCGCSLTASSQGPGLAPLLLGLAAAFLGVRRRRSA